MYATPFFFLWFSLTVLWLANPKNEKALFNFGPYCGKTLHEKTRTKHKISDQAVFVRYYLSSNFYPQFFFLLTDTPTLNGNGTICKCQSTMQTFKYNGFHQYLDHM